MCNRDDDLAGKNDKADPRLTRLICKRCEQRGEKWVMHTLECIQETQRLATEAFKKIEREPATVGELLVASVAAAREGGNPFGFGFLGNAGLKIAQQILEGRGLPTGEPEIVDTLVTQVAKE